MKLDALIFGGGAAGLWLLDLLRRKQVAALLVESNQLGYGQTIAAQGIIHGGLKYTLHGSMTSAASNIRSMPELWRRCFRGESEPDLSATRLRSESCYLWRTESLTSRLGMIGARVGLSIAPKPVSRDDRPSILARCPGTVARLEEPVISPSSFIENLARRNRHAIVKIDFENGFEFKRSSSGALHDVRLKNPRDGVWHSIRAETIVLTAGGGNAAIRRRFDLPDEVMQRRPLHLVMVRGALPELNGHCVDGKQTRVTVTTDRDSRGRTIWQIGGRISEDGVAKDRGELVRLAKRELELVLPGLDLSDTEWSSYRVDRAEGRTAGKRRPDDVVLRQEANIISVWPTKLALAPRLADLVAARLPTAKYACVDLDSNWAQPSVADPPWEVCEDWLRLPCQERKIA